MSTGPIKQFPDFSAGTGGDTGQTNAASILPFANGEKVEAVVLNRTPENLRQRTEVLRGIEEDSLYARDADRSGMALFGPALISWNGAAISTTIAALSNGAVLPQGTINVVSTAAFPASGTIIVMASGVPQTLVYTAKTATTFTIFPLAGAGTLSTGGNVTLLNTGFLTLSDNLYLVPFLTPGYPQMLPTPPVASVYGSLTLQKVGPAAGIIVTSNRRSYAGGDKISVVVVSGGALSAVLGADGRTITLTVIVGVTTLSSIITALNAITADVPATQLVTATLATGAAGGDFILGAAQAKQFITGNADGEGHTITPAALSSFFATGTNYLAEGDTLCVRYAAMREDPAGPSPLGGRRESIPENLNTSIPVGGFFNSRVSPQYLVNALPIAKVLSDRIVFINGATLPSGASLVDISAVFDTATNLRLGRVQLTYAAGTPITPKVAPQDAVGTIKNTATGNGANGLEGTGGPAGGAGLRGVGGAGGNGVYASGTDAGYGGYFESGSVGCDTALYGWFASDVDGVAVKGEALTGNSDGVSGLGNDAGAGVRGVGGGVGGPGVSGTALLGGNGPGVVGTGDGTGHGVTGTGGTGASARGGSFTAGVGSNGPGVAGTGNGTGAGGLFTGGATGPAVRANGFQEMPEFPDPATPASAKTTIAVASNGQVLPQATINVASAAAFASSGQILVRTTTGDQLVTYTGKTATTFTGCTGGTGTMATGSLVSWIQARMYFRSNALASPNHRTQFCVKWPDGLVTVIAESNAS